MSQYTNPPSHLIFPPTPKAQLLGLTGRIIKKDKTVMKRYLNRGSSGNRTHLVNYMSHALNCITPILVLRSVKPNYPHLPTHWFGSYPSSYKAILLSGQDSNLYPRAYPPMCLPIPPPDYIILICLYSGFIHFILECL
jgi:hypothetical protein